MLYQLSYLGAGRAIRLANRGGRGKPQPLQSMPDVPASPATFCGPPEHRS